MSGAAPASSGSGARLWIGPAGWSYADWNGIVYPARKPPSFRPLASVSQLFNTVEVNSSFYAVPLARTTAAWARQTPQDFRFAFKLNREFTHKQAGDPDGLLVAAFKDALGPMRHSGKLGPLLMQFPWSFRFTPEAAERLRRLSDWFEGYERVIEVRHTSWLAPDGLALLRQCGGFCNIDQPRLRECIEPTAYVFGPTAYVRFHGRNAGKWFARNIKSYERYDYLYSIEELRAWVERLTAMTAEAQDVYIITNNHHRGQSVVNALELRALLGQPAKPAPPDLLAAYPRVAAVSAPPREPGLFDLLGDPK